MKKVIGILIIIVIIGIASYTGYKMIKEAKIKNYTEAQNETGENESFPNVENEEEQQEQLVYLGIVPEEYKGYKVAAKLQIEKIDVTTYVLEEYSKPAMEVAVAKYFGPEPNEIGNYCIAGHNYIRKNMFSQLGKLEIGDEFTLTDNWHGEVCYTIYDKYKAMPAQTQSLSQKTNGEKEITLITCSDYSKKRIIIKAREKCQFGDVLKSDSF